MPVTVSKEFGTDAAREFVAKCTPEQLEGEFETVTERFGSDVEEGLLDAVIDVSPDPFPIFHMSCQSVVPAILVVATCSCPVVLL